MAKKHPSDFKILKTDFFKKWNQQNYSNLENYLKKYLKSLNLKCKQSPKSV
jgi:hypothetical protein